MDPIIGGAIIGGAGSLLGNLFGFGSNNKTNETNLKIAQMNNEFNEKMMEKQMAYNTEMWEKQNEYNSASSQRERLEEAGLNPYMMMNGGSAGTASSAGGVSAATSSGNPTMQAFKPDFTGVSQAINSAIQLRQQKELNDANINKINQDASQVQIENKYKAAELVASINEKYQNAKSTESKRIYQDLLNSTYLTQFNSDMQTAAKQRYLIAQQAEGNRIENLMKLESLKIMPAQLRANLAETLSSIDVKQKDARYKVMQAIETQYRTAGIKIDNRQKQILADSILKEAEAKAEKAKAESDYKSSTVGKVGMFLGDFGGFLGSGIGAAGAYFFGRGKGVVKGGDKPPIGSSTIYRHVVYE